MRLMRPVAPQPIEDRFVQLFAGADDGLVALHELLDRPVAHYNANDRAIVEPPRPSRIKRAERQHFGQVTSDSNNDKTSPGRLLRALSGCRHPCLHLFVRVTRTARGVRWLGHRASRATPGYGVREEDARAQPHHDEVTRGRGSLPTGHRLGAALGRARAGVGVGPLPRSSTPRWPDFQQGHSAGLAHLSAPQRGGRARPLALDIETALWRRILSPSVRGCWFRGG